MDAQLTVVATATGATIDLRATAPDTAPAAGLLDALRAAVGLSVGAELTIGGRRLIDGGTVAGCGLADGSVVRAGPGAAEPAARPAGAALDGLVVELAVTAGPDAGRRLELADGDSGELGRDQTCRLRLRDPAVSRRHLRVERSGEEVFVTDLGSANGTSISERVAGAGRRVAVSPDSTIQVGASELRVVGRPGRAGGVTTGGPALVRRPPRLIAAAPAITVSFPLPAAPTAPTRLPVLAAAVPLVAGVVFALLLHQWQLLAFTALSPAMIAGQAASDRWHHRRSSRSAAAEHAAATAVATRQLATAVRHEQERRHQAAPDLAALAAAAVLRDGLLWTRTPRCADWLTLRLGRGDVPSDVVVTGGPEPATVRDVPVCVDLVATPTVGVCGPPEASRGLMRSLVVQAAALHPPDGLRIIVLAPGGAEDWSWVRWLPHLTPRCGEPASVLVGFDDAQTAARVDELVRPSPDPDVHTLVVVDVGGAGHRPSALKRLEADDADPRRSVIWRSDDDRALPAGCRVIARLAATPDQPLELQRAGEQRPVLVAADLVAADVATGVARSLAPLRAPGHEAATRLPRTVPWRDHNGLDLSDPAATARSVARRWSLGPTTEVTLGIGADGPVRVDLRRDGPHVLLAGTTGAGKSELLLSLIAGLVAANRPDQLSLLLLDHKGGATFAPCARLPHTVGVLTDLDAASTRRALLSLTAEVRRREARLAAAGAVDLDSYLTPAGAPAERMPRLLIVVDEFAVLAVEQPDFVGGLVAVAQRGRSLGLHLVLATQRPEGVVSADIRANTRLRICLGVARDNESRDVIDTPDAAAISRRTPGRAFVRIGPGEVKEFQSVRITGPPPTVARAALTVLPAADLGAEPPVTAEPAVVRTDLDGLIDAAVMACDRLGCTPPAPPWLPPLPAHLELAGLAAPTRRGAVPWGQVDRPAQGQQEPLELDLGLGATTVITGTARSGRTNAALTIAIAAGTLVGPEQLQVWAVDAAAGLSPLAPLPHCGAVVPAHDLERVERLLRAIGEEVQARRRQATGRPRPTLMLVLDSWEALTDAGTTDGGRLADTILRLASEGPAAGLHLVITADRAGLVGRLVTAATERIVLRLADPGDLAMIGLPARHAPPDPPPGRGHRVSDLALVQIATPDPASLAAAGRWPAGPSAVRRFDALPDQVRLADVPPPDRGAGLVLGLRADDLQPVTVDDHEIGNGFIVAGPRGSGRTNALLLIARQRAGRRVAVCCGPTSPLLGEAGIVHLPADDQTHAIALLDSLGESSSLPIDLLIDDVDQLPDGPLLSRLEDLVRRPAQPDRVIVLAGSTDAMVGAFRGPVAIARRTRTGLLLGPAGSADGDLLGLRLPGRPRVTDPPGRAWLAVKGTATRLQLATLGHEPARNPPA
jgi:DNA segregation ATPase FtsK/SpoIIIE, S-DNA-T family